MIPATMMQVACGIYGRCYHRFPTAMDLTDLTNSVDALAMRTALHELILIERMPSHQHIIQPPNPWTVGTSAFISFFPAFHASPDHLPRTWKMVHCFFTFGNSRTTRSSNASTSLLVRLGKCASNTTAYPSSSPGNTRCNTGLVWRGSLVMKAEGWFMACVKWISQQFSWPGSAHQQLQASKACRDHRRELPAFCAHFPTRVSILQPNRIAAWAFVSSRYLFNHPQHNQPHDRPQQYGRGDGQPMLPGFHGTSETLIL